MHSIWPIIGLIVLLFGCAELNEVDELPILGELVELEDGSTAHYQIPDFNLINQNGDEVSKSTYNGKIRVVDFFFTSCPTICPEMSKNLNRVQEEFHGNNDLQLVSVTIDARHDNPEKLNRYAESNGYDTSNWDFLTGERDALFNLAHAHKVMAFEQDVLGEVDLLHDGTFVLIDQNHHIRGYYSGLESNQVDQMIDDIESLLKQI